MFTSSLLTGLPLLTTLVAAHFELNYPTKRGFDEENEGSFPCGGFDTPSEERTRVSLEGFPIHVTMGHDENAVQVLLARGNEPGDAFNMILKPTFRSEGLGQFCLSTIELPTDVFMDGTNATVQVITNGEGGGGLYQCADITFGLVDPTPPPECTNNTGITSSEFSAESSMRNANASEADGSAQSGGGGGEEMGESGPSPTESSMPSTTPNSAPIATAAWGVFGAAVMGAVAML